MKIGVVSDTHGDFLAWQKAWEAVLQDCDMVIHCGDILYHGPKFDPGPGHGPRQLAAALNDVPVPLLLVKGNGDSEVDTLVIEAPIQSPYLVAQIEGKRILATHGHLQPVDELLSLAARWKVDWLLTGHAHSASLTVVGSVRHLNPGSTIYGGSTCAFIEDDVATVINLDTGKPIDP